MFLGTDADKLKRKGLVLMVSFLKAKHYCFLRSLVFFGILSSVECLYAQYIPFAFWKAGSVASDPCAQASGVTINSQCWFLGAQGDNCSTTCSGATGYSEVHSDTTHFAGSGGSTSNCTTVLNAFPVTGSNGVSTASNARGCQYRPSNGNRRRGTVTTDYDIVNSNWRRACACLSDTDVTPDAINWVDFSLTSSAETITNIGASIILEISAVNNTGTPSLEYRKNGGSWTAFTTSTPASVPIANLDTLEFQVSGTVGHEATITVTNTSDGNTVLDTVVGDVISDPCNGTPTLGTTCNGGAIYAGQFDGGKYMVTPGRCTDSSTPTCTGANDNLLKIWRGSSGSNSNVAGVTNVTGYSTPSPSAERGHVITPIIAADSSVSSDSAADYCNDMTYGGYSDWYLPSKSELAYIYCHSDAGSHNTSNPAEDPNCVTYGGKTSELTGFSGSYYWSGTEEAGGGWAWGIRFNTGEVTILGKASTLNIRCIRRY